MQSPTSRKITPVTRAAGLQGKPRIPGDKSVSHRSLIFGALATGKSEASHLLESADVLSTWKCLESMGVSIQRKGERIRVEGVGLGGLKAPRATLDCGNSGTTIRLLMGVLAGAGFTAELDGDASLRRRPMRRVATPLETMGAKIELTGGNFAPLRMTGAKNLKGLEYELPVASAQLKSALLLAGLQAEGGTRLTGLVQSRDHTERMLRHFGVQVDASPAEIRIRGGQRLTGAHVQVPSDISTAAFWIAAATIIPGSVLEMENISLNPSRTGILKVLERMGARIETQLTSEEPEPIGTLRIRSAPLKGTRIAPEEIPSLIDEIPMLAVLATVAHGVTEVSGAEELRVKESDRIEAVAKNLRAMGATIETKKDGFFIEGPQPLRGATIDSEDDHRIAMAFSIAGLIAQGETLIEGSDCVAVSYPGFYQDLDGLCRG